MTPRLLDLFCGAGGCSKGYVDAGFEVVGVDIEPQPNYPYEFVQTDALHFIEAQGHELSGMDGRPFDAIHASPPCPRYSYATAVSGDRNAHPDLVAPTRDLLKATGLPYVIENVPGAPLDGPIQICGSGLGMKLRRHRLFEVNFSAMGVPCAHGWQRSNGNRIRSGHIPLEDAIVPVYGGGQAGFTVAACRAAMGIDWMTTDELNNAIPPAYTSHVGEYLLREVEARIAA